MAFRLAGRLVAAALLVVLGLALMAVLVSTPPARTRVLGWGLANLERYGIAGRAADLDYNLATLRFRIRGLALAAREHPDQPFFQAAEIRADLPWSVLWGAWAIDSLEVESARLSVVRAADGSTNLPTSRDTGSEPAGTESEAMLPIGNLQLRGLDVRWDDRAAGMSVRVPGISVALSPADDVEGIAGPLALESPAEIRWDGRATTVAAGGRLGFDGRDLTVERLALDAPEGRLVVDGTLTGVLGAPAAELTYDAVLDAAAASRWAGDGDDWSGELRATGSARGRLGALQVSTNIAPSRLVVPAVGPVDLEGAATATTETLEIRELQIGAAGGRIAARGRLQLDAERPGEAEIEWQDIDVAQLLAAWHAEPPVRVAAWIDGTLSASWPRLEPAALRLSAQAEARPRRGANGLPLQGRTSVDARDGRWTLTAQYQAGASLRLSADAQTTLQQTDLGRAPLSGVVRLEARDVEAAAGALAAALPAFRAEPMVSGQSRLAGRLTGTLAAPVLQGTIEGRDLQVAGLRSGTLEGRLLASTDRLALESFDVTFGRASANGRVAVDLAREGLDGQVALQLSELAALGDLLPAWVDPAGFVQADIDLGGALSRPRAAIRLDGSDLRAGGQRAETVAARVRFEAGELFVDDLDVRQRSGRLEIQGQYGLDTQRYRVTARAERLSLQWAPADDDAAEAVAAVVSFELAGDGSLQDPAGSGRADVSSLTWRGRELGPLAATLRVANEELEVDARVPRVNAEVTGALAIAGPDRFSRFDVASQVREGSLELLLALVSPPAAAPEVDGRFSMTASARGELDALDRTSARVELQALEATVDGTPVRLTTPALVEYEAARVRIDRFTLATPTMRLEVDGAIGRDQPGALAVSLTGSLADAAALAGVAGLTGGEPLSLGGSIALTARASGTLDEPELTADLAIEEGRAVVGSLPPVEQLSLHARYRDGVVVLERADATWQTATATATGRLPLAVLRDQLPEAVVSRLPEPAGRFELQVALTSFPVAAAAAAAGGQPIEEVGGRISGRLALGGDRIALDRLEGELELDEAVLELSGLQLTQRRPTRISLDEGRLQIEDWHWQGPSTDLIVTGQAALDDSGASSLQIAADGQLDLRVLGALLPEVATGGRAMLRLLVAGSSSNPQIEGEIAIAGGELGVAEPRLFVSGLDGTLVFDRDRLQIRQLTGTANGGSIELGGELTYPELTLGKGTLAVTARGVALEYPEGLRSSLDADLVLALGGQAPELSGTATLVRSEYRNPISLAGGLVAALRQFGAPSAPEEPTFVDRLRLNLRLVTADAIYVDNNLAELRLAADLRVVGTGAQPALAGRASIREGGEIFLGGNTFQIETGTVDFTNLTRIEPELNLRARTRAGGADITLTLTGTPDDLRSDLRSDDPAHTEPDVVSLLLTGRTAGQVGAETGAIAREQALGLLGADVLGVAGRALGLDVVRVERGTAGEAVRFDPTLVATETDPGARLTFGKQLRSDVQLIFSQSLRESGSFTWIVSHTPLPNVEIRGIVRDDNNRSYEFRHSLSFGGSSAARAGATPPAPEPSVSDIVIAGEPGLPAEELIEDLDLGAGERFDFYEWQDDRERLQTFYRERGYFEARVLSRRREVPGETPDSGTVVLEYEVRPGPRTTLTVEGYDLPGDVRRELVRAWTGSVFDQFLLADIRAIVRLHLARDRHPGATVDAEVLEPADDVKEVVVRIDPGPRVSEQRIAFHGQDRLTADDLADVIDERDLSASAWVEPLRLEQAIVARYRAAGMLAATVRAGAPEVGDSVAVLPVEIEEGPLFRISQVDLEGVAARPEEEVRRLLALPAGDVFADGRLQQAALAVERDYRQAGFNDVTIATRTAVDRAEGRVGIVVTVDEGPRQILRDIQVVGIRRTRPGVIERALRLELGEPVNLTEWFRARKRLYDTGVFRVVDIQPEPMEAMEAGPAKAGGPRVSDGAGQPQASGDPVPEQAVRARVVLEEWPAVQLRYGLQVNDERAPTGVDERDVTLGLAADLTHENVLGRAATVGLAGRYTKRFWAARTFAIVPSFFGLPVTSSVFLSRSREEIGDQSVLPFVTDRTGVTFEQRFVPAEHVLVSYGYTFERNHTFELGADPDDPFAFDITVDIARLNTTTIFDTRDDLVDATRGWFHSSSVEYADERLGSILRFAKYLAQQYYFRPVGPVVLASAARLGLADGFGQELIPSERFFAGGGNSVRGFAQDSISPLDIFGDPAGGDALLVLNQEIRFPIVWRFRGVGFVDAGNAFATIGDLSLTDLRVGYGLGLRIDTPFALLRVDYGLRVRRSPDEPRSRFFFSIGQAF